MERLCCQYILNVLVTTLLAIVWHCDAFAGPVILGGDDLTDHGRFDLPFVGAIVEESEPNLSAATADMIAIGDDYTGSLDPANESDFVSFSATAGQTIVATAVPDSLGGSTLRLLDVDGVTQLAFNDDFIDLEAQITFTLPTSGTYFLEIQSFNGDSSGTYTLQLRDRQVHILFDGWLYIQKALENLAPAVTRPGHDGSVAVLGSFDSTEFSGDEGDAGAAYHYAVPLAAANASALSGIVRFYDGATSIHQFFTDLAAGHVNPAIIVTVGTEAMNDLESSEGEALTMHALAIANFVNSGGGLLSHGFDDFDDFDDIAVGDIAFGWLAALIPGVSFLKGCNRNTLSLTTAGQLAFPGLTDSNITSGPCHNHFLNHGLPSLARDILPAVPGPMNGITVEEAEDNNSAAAANVIAIGNDYTGSLNPANDSDFVAFSAAAGQTIIAATVRGSLNFSTLRLLDVDGVTQLAFNDDFTPEPRMITFTLPASGTYFLQVQSLSGAFSGTYSLELREQVDAERDIIIGGSQVTLPGQIVLTPDVGFNSPGTTHTVLAHVIDQSRNPLSGIVVTFRVTAGPNLGAMGTGITDGQGNATFSYLSNGIIGLDNIQALFVDPETGETIVTIARNYWDLDCQPNGIPDTCDVACATFDGICAADFLACGGSTTDEDGAPAECKLPPVALCMDVIISVDIGCQANASIDNGSFGPDGNSIMLEQSPPGPYDLGTTDVTLTATDDRGASASCDATVTVVDDQIPMITCPAPPVAECAGPEGAAVSFSPVATDNCDGNLPVNCIPTSGSTFSLGGYGVTCSASDNSGNTNSCGFNVTVVDTTQPVIELHGKAAMTLECGSDTWSDPGAVASDICDSSVPVMSNADSVVNITALGSYNVTYTAIDNSGNQSSTMRTFQVTDTTAPVITSVAATPSALWPPNHKMVPVTVSATVSDACDAAPVCRITGVISNEPINGDGDGNTALDWEITGDLTVNLRAERSGKGSRRVYMITAECTDASGNSSTKTIAVTVPHDQRNGETLQKKGKK